MASVEIALSLHDLGIVIDRAHRRQGSFSECTLACSGIESMIARIGRISYLVTLGSWTLCLDLHTQTISTQSHNLIVARIRFNEAID